MNLINQSEDYLDDWYELKSFTDARIALGSTGVSVPMKSALALRLAHAHAKDAVYSSLKSAQIQRTLRSVNLSGHEVQSQAETREIYLQRPDLGRKLNQESVEILQKLPSASYDLVIVIADGLSAEAVNSSGVELTQLLVAQAEERGYRVGPIVLANQARVAIADEIGYLLRAKLTLILIGERPGLSSFDSVGAYMTYNPAPGTTDERRNCISNIRPAGLPVKSAAQKTMYLIDKAFQLQLSGVALKDDDEGTTRAVQS
jgi:ethanolamine ammonia-lyase small subunit